MTNSTKKQQLLQIIEEKRITPVFQPIVSLTDGSVFGYEALSRIDMENYGISVEEMFILAQSCDVLWSLEYLCQKKALKAVRRQLGNKKLFLNVDPCVINDEKFKSGMTKHYLERYHISPDNIIFELTERTDLQTMEETFQATVEYYKKQHYNIAIDDFGNGYAGINRVCFLCPQYIKIDIAIVRDIHKDAVKSSMVESLVHFCQGAGIFLIAEGIECSQELDKLIELGVDYGQGYYLGRPSPDLAFPKKSISKNIQKKNEERQKFQRTPSFFGDIGSICHKGVVTRCDTQAVTTYEYMKKHPEITEICAVDENNNVRGLLTRQFMDECFGGRFGYNLNSRKNVADILPKQELQVDRSMSIETVAKLALLRPQTTLYDAVIVCNGTRYYGVVTVKDLLQSAITIQVERATDANPLTHLPGNKVIQDKIEQCLKEQQPFSIMYLDLDNFKAYNDAYGFENGDLMIQAVAKSMKDACHRNEFLGHVGGDDFVIIASHFEMQEIYEKIIVSFRSRLKDLYTPEDYARKEILSRNRHGITETFPLASLSCALITNEKEPIRDVYEFSEKIAKVKKKSKQIPGDSLQKYAS